jgi:hypothetical protein
LSTEIDPTDLSPKQPDTIDSLLSKIDVSGDEIQNIKLAKRFVIVNFSDPKFPKNRAELELMNLKKHFKLSSDGFKNLKDYFREEIAPLYNKKKNDEGDPDECKARKIDHDEERISEDTQKAAKQAVSKLKPFLQLGSYQR